MKRIVTIGCGCLVSVLLASCGESAHSVEYYKQHEAERNAMLARCKADPDLITRDANCRNAGDAQATSGSFTPSQPKKW